MGINLEQAKILWQLQCQLEAQVLPESTVAPYIVGIHRWRHLIRAALQSSKTNFRAKKL